MGIIVRQSIKGTVISYAGVLIGTFNILYLYPKFLLPEHIGLLRLLQDIPILFATFLQLGAANITDRFYVYFKSEKEKDNGLPLIVFGLPIIGITVLFIVFITFFDKIVGLYKSSSPLFADFFYLVLPLTFIFMYMGVLEAYARVNFRIVVPALIRDVFLRVLFSLVIFLFALKLISINGLVYLFVFAYLLSIIFLLVYVRKLTKISLKPNFKKFNKSILIEIGTYVAFVIPGIAGSMIASKIDTIMLGIMTNLTSTGIYSLAFFIGSVVEMPKRALSQISIPVITNAWKNNDLSEIQNIYNKSSINLLIIGSLIFLIIWANINELFKIMPNGEKYIEGVYVVLFIGLSRVLDMATGVNGELIVYSKWYKVNILFVISLAVFTVAFNYFLIPDYGIEGAALATFLSITLFNAVKFFYIYLKLGIQPFTVDTIKVLLFIVGIYIVIPYLPFFGESLWELIFTVTFKTFAIAVLFFLFLFIFPVSEDISSIVKWVRNKLKQILSSK